MKVNLCVTMYVKRREECVRVPARMCVEVSVYVRMCGGACVCACMCVCVSVCVSVCMSVYVCISKPTYRCVAFRGVRTVKENEKKFFQKK